MGRGGQDLTDSEPMAPSRREEGKPEEMFHVTPEDAVVSILRTGLRAPAYLWSNDGLAEEFAEEFFDGDPWQMIVIDVSGLELRPDTSFTPFGDDHEAWISSTTVSASRLSLREY